MQQIDLSAIVRECNAAACHIFDKKQEEVIEQSVDLLFASHPESRDKVSEWPHNGVISAKSKASVRQSGVGGAGETRAEKSWQRERKC